MAKQIERRFFPVSQNNDNRIMARASDDGAGRLEGHAAVFNQETEIGGWFREVIAPGAFSRAIQEGQDVVALIDHDSSRLLGRTPNTLKLSEDREGLAVKIDLPDTEIARGLLQHISRGDIRGMSFAFIPRRVEWSKEDDDQLELRTIHDVDLVDVSAVVFPAYPGTDISVADARAIYEAEHVEVGQGPERSESEDSESEQAEQAEPGEDKEVAPDFTNEKARLRLLEAL